MIVCYSSDEWKSYQEELKGLWLDELQDEIMKEHPGIDVHSEEYSLIFEQKQFRSLEESREYEREQHEEGEF
jgi:hypothetical protein